MGQHIDIVVHTPSNINEHEHPYKDQCGFGTFSSPWNTFVKVLWERSKLVRDPFVPANYLMKWILNNTHKKSLQKLGKESQQHWATDKCASWLADDDRPTKCLMKSLIEKIVKCFTRYFYLEKLADRAPPKL